jgi:hypothetical protein
MPDKPFDGASLEEALRSGQLDKPALELVGMVKSAEEPGKIAFTPTDCESWVEIPVGLIETAEQVGQRSCRDHTHPVFRLHLKKPKDPEAQILAALLTSSAPPRFSTPSSPDFMASRGSGSWDPSATFMASRGSASWDPSATKYVRRGGLPAMTGSSRMSPFMRVGGGGIGLGGGGGLNAWGCWESECCDTCELVQCGAGPTGTECWCEIYSCRPCTRCIWPY